MLHIKSKVMKSKYSGAKKFAPGACLRVISGKKVRFWALFFSCPPPRLFGLEPWNYLWMRTGGTHFKFWCAGVGIWDGAPSTCPSYYYFIFLILLFFFETYYFIPLNIIYFMQYHFYPSFVAFFFFCVCVCVRVCVCVQLFTKYLWERQTRAVWSESALFAYAFYQTSWA